MTTKKQTEILDLLRENEGDVMSVADKLGVSGRYVRKIRGILENRGLYVPRRYQDMDGYKVKGTSTLLGPDGETKLQWVKTDEDKARQAEIQREIVEAMAEKIPKAAPVKCTVKHHDEKLLNLSILTDYHLGMLAWHEEAGSDWDLKIAEDTLTRWIVASMKAAPSAKTAILAQLGDFIHFDGLEAVTPENRNVLDSDSRFAKVVRVAIKSVRRAVQEMLKKHENVHIIMAEGNHDPASSVWLRELFKVLYEDEPRISVDNSPNPYYCYQHGKTALFFHHGHKKRPNQITRVFAGQFREVFGNTDHAYGHMGHYHHELKVEDPLMIIEQHRTLASPDAYAARGGWLSGRSASTITYHKDHGEVGRISVTPGMLE